MIELSLSSQMTFLVKLRVYSEEILKTSTDITLWYSSMQHFVSRHCDGSTFESHLQRIYLTEGHLSFENSQMYISGLEV